LLPTIYVFLHFFRHIPSFDFPLLFVLVSSSSSLLCFHLPTLVQKSSTFLLWHQQGLHGVWSKFYFKHIHNLNVLPSCKFTKSSKVWIFFSFSLKIFIMKFKSFAWKLMRGGRGNRYSMWCFVCGKKYFEHTFCAIQMGSEKPWSQCCLWSLKGYYLLDIAS